MQQAEYPPVFSPKLDGVRRPGRFDLSSISHDLRRAFAEALAEPVPEHWHGLLRNPDEPARS
jgi:hypothetical protein